MVKQINLIILGIIFSIGLASCSSKQPSESTDAGDVAEMTGEALGDDLGATEGGDSDFSSGGELSAEEQLPDSGDDFATMEEGTGGSDDFSFDSAGDGEVAGGDEFSSEGNDFSAEGDDFALEGGDEASGDTMSDLAAQDGAGLEGDLAQTPTPEPETLATPEPEPLTAPDPEPMADFGMTPEEPVEEPKAFVPLRKIADAPWVQNRVVVNGVYLARKGDTLESIAQRIYGATDRVNELTQINPTFQRRDVKPGDKVYYNSPSRPDDKESMKVYYEEMGLAPEIYVVNQPENIRTIAKSLFGEENSWKELWATNLDVESKGELPAGTQLRYWSGTPGGAAPVMAATEPEPAESMPVDLPPPVQPMEPDMNQVAAEPVPEEVPAVQEEPIAQASPPPPPPPSELPPPPPPPPTMAQTDMSAPEAAAGTMESPIPGIDFENPDQMMAMGAGAILLFAALALFVIIRKRKSRRQLDFHTSTQTQIE